jgi:hypothetical protein
MVRNYDRRMDVRIISKLVVMLRLPVNLMTRDWLLQSVVTTSRYDYSTSETAESALVKHNYYLSLSWMIRIARRRLRCYMTSVACLKSI